RTSEAGRATRRVVHFASHGGFSEADRCCIHLHNRVPPHAESAMPVRETIRKRRHFMKPGSTISACGAVLRRDLTLAWRRRGDMALPVLYALIVAVLFPFALGPDDVLLARIAGGVVLVIVLLAMLLAFDALFRPDLEDGSLEQMMLSPQPLALMVAMKILAHWLTTALPLIIIGPIIASMMHLAPHPLRVLILALLLATPLLSLLGAVLVAL